ncbi:sulfotransferase [Chroococcus sp. FPU101]|uniref:sulfotransferase family protein n=1 Tax=Chroococcus sp. FPU101 TaxID=1974212 RepID=UPI001A8DE98B|nr:sulfotransferase [Chroococcus sp. FPU101]GFE68940.1 nucleoside triphosphate hydrolase superfamily protein [Chroococcus sp. FPU101]
MNLISTLKKLPRNSVYSYYLWLLAQKKPKLKTIFINSHMRSGSTLLSHLLNSHPKIYGIGETGLTYHSEADLELMMCRVSWYFRKMSIPEDYVFDKLLHNRLLVNKDLLNHEDIYYIFLVRNPEDTLLSLSKLFTNRTLPDLYQYYCERLLMMENDFKNIKNYSKVIIITYEQLLNETTQTFETLQRFLQTKEPFVEQYSLTPWTGKKYIGDSSKNIKAGYILRKNNKQETLQFPSDLLQNAWNYYHKWYELQSLTQHNSL